MKTALIIGAAAIAVYAIWRTQQTVVQPGAATGNAAAGMTAGGAAQTNFGGTAVRGLLSGRGSSQPAVIVSAERYSQVLAEVAARQFAPLATAPSPGSTRYQEVGIRGVLGTAPNGTPAGVTDPVFLRN